MDAGTVLAVIIGKYMVGATQMSDLVARRSLTTYAAAFLDAAVVSGLKSSSSAPPQAGKPANSQRTH